MNILDELEQEKLYLERAVIRKREIKAIMKPLIKQYEAVKKEIDERKKRAERLISEHQKIKATRIYSDYLDTINLDESELKFP
jgi:hypothetical protein